MDFRSLLDKAANNAKRVTKTLEELESEKELEKKNERQRINLEKKEKLALAMKKRAEIPKREPTPEKKFVIPKKKAAEPSIDRDKVLSFLAKKEQEKKDSDKQKRVERENLIQLRMQGNGGKANKKLGKHFGLNPIDLQIRYGNDHTHVERLQKQQWREEEEIDNLSSQYRGGVYKAIQEKNKKVQNDDSKHKEPHRMATSKSNSLAGLSSRHASTRDHFSPPKETKKEVTKSTISLEKKKRPAAPPVDFSALMKVAADKSAGKNVDLSLLAPPPPKILKFNNERPMAFKDSRPTSSKDNRSTPKNGTVAQKFSAGVSSFSNSRSHNANTSKLASSSIPTKNSSIGSSHSLKRPDSNSKSSTKNVGETQLAEKDKSKKDPKGRFVKGPTPPPAIPQAVLGRKYLPSDVRYKQQQEMLKAAGLPTSSSNVHKRTDVKKVPTSSLSRPADREKIVPRPITSSSRKNSHVSNGREKAMEIERRRRQVEKKRFEKERYDRIVERERERERQKYREMYNEEEEEDEDEYDSDMDDFIDDSGMDMDDFSRMDFEETLTAVNPKYNKKIWKERERMISDRDMETNYRTIAAEEARSARLGFMEDVYEAKKNKSEAL